MPEAAEKEELEIIETEDEAQEVETQEVDTGSEESEQKADNDDDELASYSESVQRRIRTLTGKYREEERQRQAALEYAEGVKKQNEELQDKNLLLV